MVEDVHSEQAGSMTAAPPPPTDPVPPGADDRSGPRVSAEEMRELSRIRRSTGDRKIAGVAAGLARHFDIDPLLVRVVLAVLIFFGGGGLIVYIAGWLLIPEDDGSPAPVRLDDRSRTAALAIAGALAGLALIGDSFGGWHFPWPLAVVGVIVVVFLSRRPDRRTEPHGVPGQPGGTDSPGDAGTPSYVGYQPGNAPESGAGQQPGSPGMPPMPTMPPTPQPQRQRGPILFGFAIALAALAVGSLATLELAGVAVADSAYPAAVMATCGVMLLVGAFYGRGGGLILVGLLAAAATASATLVPDPEDFSIGEVHRTPDTASEVRDETLGIGDMRIDLSEISDPDALDGESLHLDLRVGRLEVIVPDDGLTVEVEADIQGVGQIQLFGDRADRSDEAVHDGGTGAPVLELDTDLFLGEIVVWTEEEAEAA